MIPKSIIAIGLSVLGIIITPGEGGTTLIRVYSEKSAQSVKRGGAGSTVRLGLLAGSLFALGLSLLTWVSMEASEIERRYGSAPGGRR